MKKKKFSLYAEIRGKAVFIGNFENKERAEGLGRFISKKYMVLENI